MLKNKGLHLNNIFGFVSSHIISKKSLKYQFQLSPLNLSIIVSEQFIRKPICKVLLVRIIRLRRNEKYVALKTFGIIKDIIPD